MRRFSFLSAVLSSALFAAAAQATLLDDGSFNSATPDSQTSNSAWVLNSNNPDPAVPADEAAQFQDAAWASNDAGAPEHGVWFKAFTGKPGGGLAQADITQSIVASDGGSLFLSFDARKETNFAADSWGVTLSSGGTGGSATLDLLTSAPADGSWNTYNLSLSGVSAGDTITVSGAMVNGADALTNPQSAFLDNFNLVPEPGTIGLAVFGLLGLAGLRRRR